MWTFSVQAQFAPSKIAISEPLSKSLTAIDNAVGTYLTALNQALDAAQLTEEDAVTSFVTREAALLKQRSGHVTLNLQGKKAEEIVVCKGGFAALDQESKAEMIAAYRAITANKSLTASFTQARTALDLAISAEVTRVSENPDYCPPIARALAQTIRARTRPDVTAVSSPLLFAVMKCFPIVVQNGHEVSAVAFTTMEVPYKEFETLCGEIQTAIGAPFTIYSAKRLEDLTELHSESLTQQQLLEHKGQYFTAVDFDSASKKFIFGTRAVPISKTPPVFLGGEAPPIGTNKIALGTDNVGLRVRKLDGGLTVCGFVASYSKK